MEPYICKHCNKECTIENRISGEYAVCAGCQMATLIDPSLDTVSVEWPPAICDEDAEYREVVDFLYGTPMQPATDLPDVKSTALTREEAHRRWLNEKF